MIEHHPAVKKGHDRKAAAKHEGASKAEEAEELYQDGNRRGQLARCSRNPYGNQAAAGQLAGACSDQPLRRRAEEPNRKPCQKDQRHQLSPGRDRGYGQYESYPPEESVLTECLP